MSRKPAFDSPAQPEITPPAPPPNPGIATGVEVAGLDALIAVYRANPNDYFAKVWCASIQLNSGRAGASLGSTDIEPIETLEDRLIEAHGGPMHLRIRLKRRDGPFVAQCDHEIGPTAVAATERRRDESDRLRAQIAQQMNAAQQQPPPPVSSVPTNPFSGALDVIKVAAELASQMRAHNAVPTQEPANAERLLAAGMDIGKTLGRRADESIFGLLREMGPQLIPAVDRLIGIFSDNAQARRLEAAARAEIVREQVRQHAARTAAASATSQSTPQVEQRETEDEAA